MKKTFNKEEDVKAAVKEILKATPNCYWFMPPANDTPTSFSWNMRLRRWKLAIFAALAFACSAAVLACVAVGTLLN